jgi:PBP1b-binding outer membrane lipoprotein LpoB
MVQTKICNKKNKKEKLMYKYLLVIFILALFVVGCTDESNMLTPVNNQVNNSEIVSNPNQINLPSDNQTFDNNTSTNQLIIRIDSTKVPGGIVSPDSRWGFIN